CNTNVVRSRPPVVEIQSRVAVPASRFNDVQRLAVLQRKAHTCATVSFALDKLNGARGLPVEIGRATTKWLVKVAHQVATSRNTHHVARLGITGLRSGYREGFSWHLQRFHGHDFYAQATIDDGVIERFLRCGTEPRTVKRHVGSALRHAEWKPPAHQLAD